MRVHILRISCRLNGSEDLLGRRDGLVDVLLSVSQGGEASFVLGRSQVDALAASTAALAQIPNVFQDLST